MASTSTSMRADEVIEWKGAVGQSWRGSV